VMVIFNQIMQLHLYAASVNVVFGTVVLVVLSVLFVGLLAAPVLLFYRLPQSLTPPENEAEMPEYRQKMGKRLAANKLLKSENYNFSQPEQMQKALSVLDLQANAVMQKTARNVFLATAISQNGKLDALMVLTTHTKMIWDVAHIYYQRPSPRDLLRLYSNVAATTLLASQIEDLDISEQIEPVLGTVLQGSAMKSVPFVGPLSGVILDSLLEGSINAFLTLRVGVITKRYCGALEPFQARKARRIALAEASGMLKTLVVQSSGQVVNAMLKTARKAGADTVRSGVQIAGKATQTVKKGFYGWFRRGSPITEPRD
jgi:Domain of unknown function (DUF697)